MRPPTQWLLLRGLARETGHWYEFLDAFQQCVHPAPVHALDLSGAGTERATPAPLTAAAVAADVARRLPAMGNASAGWGVLGVSLGGMVTLELCASPSVVIDAGVLINTSSNESPRHHRLRPGAILGFVEIAMSKGLRREQALLRLTSHLGPAERNRYARRALQLWCRNPFLRRTAVRQLVAASRFSAPPASTLATPLLFLSSRGDALVNPECSSVLSNRYQSPSLQHPWAGHDLPLDDPQWVCTKVRQWIQTLSL